MNGNPCYDGIVLVIGNGVVNKNGGGDGSLNGSILVANPMSAASKSFSQPMKCIAGSPVDHAQIMRVFTGRLIPGA